MFLWADSDEPIEVGALKIAKIGMVTPDGPAGISTPIETSFTVLSEQYVSVGQDSSYYENLVDLLGVEGAGDVLGSLQDLAYRPHRLDEVLDSAVVSESLLRYLGTSMIREQFNRILYGEDAQVKSFELKYQYLGLDENRKEAVSFHVERESSPPTNIHVLIGSNGAGKSRALRDMRAFFDQDEPFESPRAYLSMSDGTEIAGVVSVSFSAFDQEPATSTRTPKNPRYTVADVRYDSERHLGEQFREALSGCVDSGPDRLKRLQGALAFLESDPLLWSAISANSKRPLARLDFDALSSGHKIVLLTIVNLVRLVDEKCLVLLDEPETHLHPPLLAALIRAISWLLTDRNGVAIVATHSPVVLQEVPKGCAWKITRSGLNSRIDQIADETFGENVGVLTQDVFRLELSRSGYYKLLTEAAAASATYQEALARLGGSLGEEASLILRGLVSGNS